MNRARPDIARQRGMQEPQVDIDLRGLILMLWRRKMVIIGVLLIGLSLATILMAFMRPQFTARSLLLIEAAKQQKTLEELQFLVDSMRFDGSLILGELEVLRSRTLARKVVERLDLMTDPEFNGRFRAPPPLPADTADKDKKAGTFRSLSVYKSELDNLPPEVVDQQMAEVVTRFLRGLNVRTIPGSFAIQVEYTSADPNKAALIANTMVDVYIEQRLDEKFQAAKKLTEWLDRRLGELRTQVRSSEAAVEEYKTTHNLVEGARNYVSAEQLSDINSRLVLAKAQQAEAEARLEQVKTIKPEDGDAGMMKDLLDTGLINELRINEVRLQGEISELSTRYGEKHPEILKRRSELGDLRSVLQQELGKTRQSVDSEVKFARARVKALEEGIAEATGQRNVDNEAMIKLRELEREAESTRLIFDTFLKTYKKSDEQEELQDSEVRVISYAIVPNNPSYPNKILLLLLSASISLFVGLALATLLEKLDNSFRSATQLEDLTGYPCYALIPAVEDMSQVEVARYILSKPSSVVAEAVRTLRMVLNLRPHKSGTKPKVITLTSSFPGEGKTTLSIWLARLAAKSGEKVIIIDADLRRPSVHRALGISNDVTLAEYLSGTHDLDQVIRKDDASGAHMILARSVPNSALDLVSSAKMEKLVASLRQVYDLVIIDSPACLAVSDARVLTQMSDQVLYAVAWDRTPREVVQSGIKHFTDMGQDSLAFVLTNVDIKRHVRYGYGDTAYYYGRYKEYKAA